MRAASANRYAAVIRWISLVTIAVSLVLILQTLPIDILFQHAEGWIEAQGPRGPLLFALLYIAAVVLLVPGSALTLAAGALFGLLVGTIVVSLASTTGATLAFLISRHLARARVVASVRRHPRLSAVERAVSGGGWKIVALLRLSPVVPFNVQNYLYGVTGIRLGAYVLTSWLAMLPGTFLYVYLGAIGREGVGGAGGPRQRGPLEWGLLIVGLLATIALTVYVARQARHALQQRTDIDRMTESSTELAAVQGWRWDTTILVILALGAAGGAIFARSQSVGP